EREPGLPPHVHPHADEGDRDAGVLADRPMPFRGHARVDEDLRHRVLRRRRRLALVRLPEVADVVLRMVVADELEGVGDRLDEVLLADHGHGMGAEARNALPKGFQPCNFTIARPDLRSAAQRRAARARMRRAVATTGASTILPSTFTALPPEAASASTTRRAHASSSGAGAKASFTTRTCFGWMQSLPPKPKRFARSVSSRRRGSSSVCTVTPSTAGASPARRVAIDTAKRSGASSGSPSL